MEFPRRRFLYNVLCGGVSSALRVLSPSFFLSLSPSLSLSLSLPCSPYDVLISFPLHSGHTIFYFVSPVVAIIGIPLFALLPSMFCWQKIIRPIYMKRRQRIINAAKRVVGIAAGDSAEKNENATKDDVALLAREAAGEEAPARDPTPSHWCFIDDNKHRQGPCSHALMRCWLSSGALDENLLIIACNAKGKWVCGKWRRLRDIDERVSPLRCDAATPIDDSDTALCWFFVDTNGHTQGPHPHHHLVHWFTDAHLHGSTWVALSSPAGTQIGEWRKLASLVGNASDGEELAEDTVEVHAPWVKVVHDGTTMFYNTETQETSHEPPPRLGTIDDTATTTSSATRRMEDEGDGVSGGDDDNGDEKVKNGDENVDDKDVAIDLAPEDDDGENDGDGDGASSQPKTKTKQRLSLFPRASRTDIGRTHTSSSQRRASAAVYDTQFFAALAALPKMNDEKKSDDDDAKGDDDDAAARPSSTSSFGDAVSAEGGREMISRGVVESILPPGIKSTDLDRLTRKFGTPMFGASTDDEILEYQIFEYLKSRRSFCDQIRHKMKKGRTKRAEKREEKMRREAGGTWQRFFDLKEGEVYFINSKTHERREELPTIGGMVEMSQMNDEKSSQTTTTTTTSGDAEGIHIDVAPFEAHQRPEYAMDSAGFAKLQRHLENQRVLIAVMTTLVIIIYFMYMRVTRALLEVFSVVRINGDTYLTRSVDLQANTPEHNVVRVIAGLWLIGFTVGVPVVSFGTLIWLHRTGRENDPRYRTAIGFLNDGYKRKFFWWEAVVLLRKLCLLLVADVISPDDGFLQSFLAVAVLSVSMVIQAWAQPYQSITINVLDMAAMAAVYATRLGAILFSHVRSSEGEGVVRCCFRAFLLSCCSLSRSLSLSVSVSVSVSLSLSLSLALALGLSLSLSLFFNLSHSYGKSATRKKWNVRLEPSRPK